MNSTSARRALGRKPERRQGRGTRRAAPAALALLLMLCLALPAASAAAGPLDLLPLPGLQPPPGKPQAQKRKAEPARKARLDLRLERTPVIVKSDYTRLPPMGKRGQLGLNRVDGAPFFLAHQQLGDLYVRAGIIRERKRLVKRGLKAFDYAFRRQRRNGGFGRIQTEEYAFFVEAVAHSVLLLEQTRYGKNNRRKLADYRRNLRRAARRMVAPAAWSAFKHRNASYTHTGFTVGAALAEAGLVTGQRSFIRRARTAIRLGLSRQRRSGANPELGGYDVRYQMAGIAYAERWSVYFPRGPLARRVRRMVSHGLKWMSKRVDRDGWIDYRGSSRTCRERNTNGESKTPGYSYAIRGFAYWGALTHSKKHSKEARRAYSYLRHRQRGRSLCSSKGPVSRHRRHGRGGGGRDTPGTPLLDSIGLNDLLG